MMKFGLAGLALLAMLALAVCGGGGGGGTSAPVAVNAQATTLTGITVNGTPVATFVVKDAAGNPVTGLKLSDPANVTGPCGGANVSFAIAKYDGANWQSLISRQRYATSSAGRNAVAEAALDPTPATTSSTNVGGLTESSGVYTYKFATDVTTTLPLSGAPSYASLGQVANNGNLAVKDGKTIHRVALQLCYVDPTTKATVKLNPYMDFTLGADGKGTPAVSAQGNLIPAVQVVDRASCNACHQNFALHTDPAGPVVGNFVDPQTCVMCHNPGSSDFLTGNAIDFKFMVHKFHMGKRLTQSYVVGTSVAANMLYPQDQRNCSKCHTGTATGANVAVSTINGDNWQSKPSKNACFACHDDYKIAGSSWQLMHAGAPGVNVVNPDANADGVCAGCHGAAAPLVVTATKHAITELGLSANYRFNLWKITRNADSTVTVEYSVSNPATGVDYDILNSQYRFSVSNPTPTTATTMFQFGGVNLLFAWGGRDYANTGAIGRAWSSSCTVVAPATSCIPTVQAEAPLTRGQPVSLNAEFDPTVQRVPGSNHFTLKSTVLPSTGTITVALVGNVSQQKDAYSSWTVPVANVVQNFAMSGAVQTRRQVVSADKCNACHGQNIAYTDIASFAPGLSGHGGSTDPQTCVICHNGNLDGSSALAGQADSGDFKRMIHMMHKAQRANFPAMPSALITMANSTSQSMPAAMAGSYTGIMNCTLCHVNNTFMTSQSDMGSSTLINTSNPLDPSLNLIITPKAAACSACHTDATGNSMMTHMIQTGGAAFGTLTQANASTVFESCDGCHQSGATKPVDQVHLGLAN